MGGICDFAVKKVLIEDNCGRYASCFWLNLFRSSPAGYVNKTAAWQTI